MVDPIGPRRRSRSVGRARGPRWLFAASVVAVTVLAGGCGETTFGSKSPITEQGKHTLGLWQGFFIAASAVGLLVLGLIAFVTIRYRRRNDDDVPSQKADNLRIEAFYTIVPVLTVIVLFAFSIGVERLVTDTDPKPDLVVDVTGFQWGWTFDYPADDVTITGSGNVNPPTLVLPVGKTVQLRLHTLDVIHSFWVPSFLQKKDMIPGRVNTMDVTPTHLGRFSGKCAEYCSLDHARMVFTLEVVKPADFADALAAAKREATEAEADR